jgi:hypothetical protein
MGLVYQHHIRDKVTVLVRPRFQDKRVMDGHNRSSSSSSKIRIVTFRCRLYSISIAIRGRRIRRKGIGVERT